ncbi:hypothetical protein PXK33_20810 [Phaeobacter gallaeciensis]|uniref:Uncharacterized protein n=1 Tax=Phaeobacter gallaeciensis TaxID=60890 RepID=A0ABD4XFP6_9RHOB|nr:hypothetical protein [Phaeobacter gallaeciensis]MDE4168177.1 hypothetical protein [Phaeobacter gallaeciensis]
MSTVRALRSRFQHGVEWRRSELIISLGGCLLLQQVATASLKRTSGRPQKINFRMPRSGPSKPPFFATAQSWTRHTHATGDKNEAADAAKVLLTGGVGSLKAFRQIDPLKVDKVGIGGTKI